MAVRYAWITPTLWKGVDPQTAGEHLESLASDEGFIDRDLVLEDALRPRSPLHTCFDWDDASAAAHYRRRQAKSLVQNLVIKKRNTPTRTKAFVFVHPRAHAKRTIMSLERAMKVPSLREQVVQQAFRELQKWAERYRDYAELTAVRASIIAAIERELAAATG
jgi:hypothetical protein